MLHFSIQGLITVEQYFQLAEADNTNSLYMVVDLRCGLPIAQDELDLFEPTAPGDLRWLLVREDFAKEMTHLLNTVFQ